MSFCNFRFAVRFAVAIAVLVAEERVQNPFPRFLGGGAGVYYQAVIWWSPNPKLLGN